jgi:hypothetical protein
MRLLRKVASLHVAAATMGHEYLYGIEIADAAKCDMHHNTPLISTIVVGLVLAFVLGLVHSAFACHLWSAISSPVC